MLAEMLTKTRVVPLIQADDPVVAVKTVQALIDGGLNIIEVVLRTNAAMSCLEKICDAFPDAHVGAGTVLSQAQAEEAAKRGAKFIVSPGLSPDVVKWCQQHELEIFPGVVTPSELQLASNLGLSRVKFFPAGLSGGVPMLKALSAVFRNMQFMPTGGVSAENLREFLAVPSVIACGGSWLTPSAAIEAGDFRMITKLAEEAVQLARRSAQ